MPQQNTAVPRRSRSELMSMFDKQNSVKHLFDRQNSVSTVATETCSFSSGEMSMYHQPLEKTIRTVHFDMVDEDHVRCEVKEVEKYSDPDLWWQPEETYEIRSECLTIVQDSQEDPNSIAYPTLRFLEQGWKEGIAGSQQLLLHMAASPQTRGLEFYIVPGLSERSRDHVQDVVHDQANKVSPNSLSAAARQASRPCLRLALLRARYDVEAARDDAVPKTEES